MPTFWKHLSGSFLGKIASVLFIAICGFLGFGPDKWAKFIFTNLPTWFTPKILRYIFLLLGFITFLTLSKNYISSVFISFKTFLVKVFCNIEWIDGPHSIHSFGYIISKPHDIALAGSIQLKGRNKSKSSIFVKKAYLQSLVTSEIIQAEIDGIQAENIEIFSGSPFSLIVKFPNEDGTLTKNSIRGISLQSFLKRFSNFEIIIETNKKTYKVEFNSKETHKWVSEVHMGLMMPPPSKKSRVIKRG